MSGPAHAHASPDGPWAATLLDSIRERPEVQVAAAYVGGAWLLYDIADLVVFAFDFPDAVLRVLLGVLVVGGVLALFLGRWLRLTLLAVREGRGRADEDIRGVPDFLEPALLRVIQAVSRRTAAAATAVSMLVFLLVFLFLWNSWAIAHERQIPDTRIAVTVFPFGDAGAPSLGAGVAELLSVVLDGTPGLRVVDPSTAWRSIGTTADGTPLTPGVERARTLGSELGVDHVVTGRLIRPGARMEVVARIHEIGASDRDVPIRLSAHEDSLGAALERLAVEIVASVWRRQQLPTVPEIDRAATASAEALKAYLEAKGASRRGRWEDAKAQLERAVVLDSTFALAHLELFTVESNLLFLRGQPFVGLRPIIDRAERHGARLTPRNRMRIDARRALDETDGARAAFLFERILSIDSLDLDALEGAATTSLVHGWQFGDGEEDVVRAYERVLGADPDNTRALANLARMAIWRDAPRAAAPWIAQLAARDSLPPDGYGAIGSFEILTAPSSVVDSLLRARANEDVGVATTVLRELRTVRPGLAERFLAELRIDSMPAYHRALGQGARAQLWMARGRISGVDSLLRAGHLEGLRIPLAAYHVAAAMAGVGDTVSAIRSARELASWTPLDSLERYVATREVWISAWAVGSYHAALGDSVQARRWQRAIAALPADEMSTVPEWPSALAADIEARLAARRGNRAEAESWARRAYELWPIHSFTALENQPEPAMRFHLAEILRARGASSAAEALYRSLCPPHTWMGFYTARASLELAKLLEAREAMPEAALRYRTAARMWSSGDPLVVGERLEEARAGLTRTGG